ncbi:MULTISPECIES: MurR/RpiR family transcriptional regulator [unclassified Rhizobium]|uniref:MurR/RpiR family transcriptional regulator n=1 Tax=unclassified Rhizobium TaxID=2613769 RepID=UPI000EA8C337|nr:MULTISPECIES: MurR/RpiR family transcriptional regulator [unclassified Rhizobium]AYG67413.1 MurR/RpiR family transcriptional regulator [Rhizobium sp. CCGE531]AYG73807.1 MurR/RpiR family transcriptional regulator [Rhizobium sp. CCGE532]
MEDLSQKLRQYIKIGTPAERRIAKYFSEHLNELPFETASSVADRLELSPMTVGRFLRSLGYHGLDGIKVHLKENAPTFTSPLPNILEQLQKDASEGRPLATQIAEQVEMLQHIYNLASQPQWREAATTILSAGNVFVAAHPSLAGIGRHFCDRLTFARDQVLFLDGANGSYIELFGERSEDGLFVIIDSPRFVSSRLLARSARRSGCKVLLVTGQFTEWAHEFANITLSLPPQRANSRENLAAIMSLLEYLAVTVIQAAGETAETRIRRIEELQGMFAHAPLR